MKRTSLRRHIQPLLAITLLLAGPALNAGDWIDLRGAMPMHGDATAGARKAAVCVACHGPNGNAIVPAFPRLAGQRGDYLYWSLVNFKRGALPQSPMTAQAAQLSDADMRDVAAYFAAQIQTASAQSTTPTASDRGALLFRAGDRERGIPACQGCHGSDAAGLTDPIARTWPSLRGQHSEYIVQRLKAYRDSAPRASSNDFIMQGVAQNLDDESITALADWLGALPPATAN